MEISANSKILGKPVNLHPLYAGQAVVVTFLYWLEQVVSAVSSLHDSLPVLTAQLQLHPVLSRNEIRDIFSNWLSTLCEIVNSLVFFIFTTSQQPETYKPILEVEVTRSHIMTDIGFEPMSKT